MELRQIRYFVVMAEELHFGRAAERLHIEQSPLSRAIKALEDDLGVSLFKRSRRGTQMTMAGNELLEQAKRILAAVDQLRATARSAQFGSVASIRVGLLESFSQPRLLALLASCRAEEPDVEITLFELPFSQQVKNLRDGLLDVSLSWCADPGEGICCQSLWTDPLVAVLPACHPLSEHDSISLGDLARETLLVGKPDHESGSSLQFAKLLKPVCSQPIRTLEILTSLGMLVPLVAARYGVGLILAQQAEAMHHPDIVIRSLIGTPTLTTYLLRAKGAAPTAINRFLERAHRIGLDALLPSSVPQAPIPSAF